MKFNVKALSHAVKRVGDVVRTCSVRRRADQEIEVAFDAHGLTVRGVALSPVPVDVRVRVPAMVVDVLSEPPSSEPRIVNLVNLTKMLKACDADTDVELDSNALRFTMNDGKLSLTTLEANMPARTAQINPRVVHFNLAAMAAGFGVVDHARSADSTRPHLCGALLHIVPDARPTLIATDGYRLISHKFGVFGDVEMEPAPHPVVKVFGEIDVWIPDPVCAALASTKKVLGSARARLSLVFDRNTPKSAILEYGSERWEWAPNDCTFPNFMQLIDAHDRGNQHYKFQLPAELEPFARRCVKVADVKDHSVIFETYDGTLFARCRWRYFDDAGNVVEPFAKSWVVGESSVNRKTAFGVKYLADALNAVPTGEISLASDGRSSMRLRNDSTTVLLMPECL